ncbi:MAG: asparaginase [Alphaproteobacteria bacterium]|nr:asparaginase [Alphaproteobacteria bacterium]
MNPVLVEVTRGGTVESQHRGAIAVCDAAGKVVASWGDTPNAVFPRSAFKSLQALPLVETGAADAFRLSDEHLALACASHSSEPMHVERVESWLGKIVAKESDLACGPHLPFHEPTAHKMLRDGQRPCRIHNNCSGKHTGFLTVARHLKIATEGYERPDHPVQVLVREAIANLCGVDANAMPVGVDGCAAPNYAIPLTHLATGMARLGDTAMLDATRAVAAKRIVAAWKAHPLLVSGTGRACADLIEAARGRAVVKTGAEAVFMAVLPDQGLGIALKIDDGGTRAAETAMAKLLVLLEAADAAAPQLARHLNPTIKNWRGDVVGERRTTAALANLKRQ